MVKSNVTAVRGQLNKNGPTATTDAQRQPNEIGSTKVTVPVNTNEGGAAASLTNNLVDELRNSEELDDDEEIDQDAIDDENIKKLQEQAKILSSATKEFMNQNKTANQVNPANQTSSNNPVDLPTEAPLQVTTGSPEYEELEPPWQAEDSVTQPSIFTEAVTPAPVTEREISDPEPIKEEPVSVSNNASILSSSSDKNKTVTENQEPSQTIIASVPSPTPPPQAEVNPAPKLTSPPPLLGLMKSGTPTVVAAEAAEKTLGKPLSAEEPINQPNVDEPKNITETVESETKQIVKNDNFGEELKEGIQANGETVAKEIEENFEQPQKILEGSKNVSQEVVESTQEPVQTNNVNTAEMNNLAESSESKIEVIPKIQEPPKPATNEGGPNSTTPEITDEKPVELSPPLVIKNETPNLTSSEESSTTSNGIPAIADSPGISNEALETVEIVDPKPEVAESVEEKPQEKLEEEKFQTPLEPVPLEPLKPLQTIESDLSSQVEEKIENVNQNNSEEKSENTGDNELDSPSSIVDNTTNVETPTPAPDVISTLPFKPSIRQLLETDPKDLPVEEPTHQHSETQQQEEHKPTEPQHQTKVSPTPPLMVGRGSIKELKRPEEEPEIDVNNEKGKKFSVNVF